MFKVTPRSSLFGSNLIRKSITRLFVDKDGNLSHFNDNILQEHLDDDDENVHDYYGDKKYVHRAPTGKQQDGHYHMIDALYQQLLKLIQRNGFGIEELNQALGGQVGNDLVRSIINAYIRDHNKDMIRREGNDTGKLLPDSLHPDWRKIVPGSWVSEEDAYKDDNVYSSHADKDKHGTSQVRNYQTDGINETGKLITVSTKKDHVVDPNSDTTQYIDGAFVPFHRQVEPVTKLYNNWLKEQLGLPVDAKGPLDDDDGLLQDYERLVLPLSAISSGQVHGIKSKDYDEINRTGRLSPEYEQRTNMYGDTRYQPPPQVKPIHSLGIGGVHYPSEMFISDKRTGRPRTEGGHDRIAAVKQFLQNIANPDLALPSHMSAEDRRTAKALLGQNLDQLARSPAISHLFGGGTSKATGKGKRGFGVDEDNQPTYLTRVANDLKLDPNRVKTLRDAIRVNYPESYKSGKQSKDIVHNLHALNAGLVNNLIRQGDPNPGLTAQNMIRSHGMDRLTPEQQTIAGFGHAIVDLHSKFHQASLPIATETQYAGFDPTSLQGVTPESPALQQLMVERPPEQMVAKSILKSFEDLQMKSARNDKSIMKYVQSNLSINSINDVRKYSVDNNLTTSDVYAIVSTQGDWNAVSKQWDIPIDVVKGIKLTFGDA